MSEGITVPRRAGYKAQLKLERAEAVVNAFCEFYADLSALYKRRIPAARGDDALAIRRAWLRASA